MSLPEDYLNRLSKRVLSETPSLNYALYPPEWIQQKDMAEDGWEAFDAERREIIEALWEKAREDLRTHGYAAVKERLEDLKTDWEQHDAAAKVHEGHAEYFTLAGMRCNAMAEEYGEETTVSETALRLHEKQTGDSWQDLRNEGWTIGGGSIGDAPVKLGMHFHLDDDRMAPYGLEHKPPGRDAHFHFDKETWRVAAELVGIRRSRSLRRLVDILKLRDLITFQSELTLAVLRRDRKVGWVSPWIPPKPRERWEEGLPEGPDWGARVGSWDVLRGPIIRWRMELLKDDESRTLTEIAGMIAKRLAEDAQMALACRKNGLSPDSFSDKRLRDVWNRHKRDLGMDDEG